MSISLPKELQTQKISSLSGELKSIAEELLAEKFGVEEEVVERKAPDPGFGPGFDPRFMDSHTYGMRTTRITLESCYELLKDFDRQNVRRERRQFRMGKEELRELARDARFDQVSTCRYETREPSIFGVPIRIEGRYTGRIDLVETF